MKIIHLLLLLTALLSGAARAGTELIFLNGIDGYPEKSEQSLNKILQILVSNGHFEEISQSSVGFSFYSNPGDGVIDDKVELLIQADISALALTRAKNEFGDEITAQSNEYKLELGRIYYDRIYTPEDSIHIYSVVLDLGRVLIERVVNGDKIILVAHSQGNYFAEAVDGFLRYASKTEGLNLDFDKIKYVGAASVAASTPNNRYISIQEDLALDAHALSILVKKNAFMLPRNYNACKYLYVDCFSELNSLDFWTKHGFLEVYTSEKTDFLSGKTFSSILSLYIMESLRELNFIPLPEITELTFTTATVNTAAKLTAMFSADMQTRYQTTGDYVPKAGKEGYWTDHRTFVIEFDSFTSGGQITLVASGFQSMAGQPMAADRVFTFPQQSAISSCPSAVRSVVFSEDFTSSQLDPQKWITANSGGGFVTGGGYLSAQSGTIGFPYIQTVSNPFPSSGNYSFYCKSQYDYISSAGTGACAAVQNVIPYRSATWGYDAGTAFAVWGGFATNPIAYSMSGLDSYNGPMDSLPHEFEACVVNGTLSYYVDGIQRATALMPIGWTPPRYIYIGNPVSGAMGGSTFKTFKLEVRALE